MKRALGVAGRVAFGAGLTGGLLALAAAPASAAAGSLTVSPTGTLDHNAVLSANGSYDNSTSPNTVPVQLSVVKPDSSSQVLDKTSAGPLQRSRTLAGTVDTSALNVNGDYVFTLSANGTAAKSVTVTLRVPPAAVGNFGASPSGTVAHFTWSANGEPDLAGYDLVDETDSSQPRDLTPGGLGTNVCSGGSCGVDIDFGAGAAGTSRTFVAYALRYTSASHSSTIASASPSAPATVAFAAPAPPPSSAPAGSGDTGGAASGGSSGAAGGGTGSAGGSGSTSGGSTSGGTTARGTSHGGGKSISASHPSTALKAYLPTLSAGAAPNLPSVVTEIKPLPQGTYKPTLAYPDQVIPGERVVHKRGTAIASVRDDLVRVLDVSALWKALGAAAVLLLVAGHLRAWLESVDLADR